MKKERNEEELNKEAIPSERQIPEEKSDAADKSDPEDKSNPEASDEAAAEDESFEETEPEDESFEEPDYEAILNDGWADDVELHYPTLDNTDDDTADDADPAGEFLLSDEEEKKAPAGKKKEKKDKKEKKTDASPRKKHGFRLFMLIWLGSLIILLTLALSYFYDFLQRYEEYYPSSLPEREMDRIIELLATSDMDDIYRLATTPPPVAEGHSETDTRKALLHLLNDPSLSYRMLPARDRKQRDYEILVQESAIGKATLVISPVDTLEYGLPLWYLASLEFYSVETPSEED